MSHLTFAVAIATLILSSYLSYACFCVIHRMTKRTAWTLAYSVISIAAVGAYGFLESLGYIAGILSSLSPSLVILCAALSLIARRYPRLIV